MRQLKFRVWNVIEGKWNGIHNQEPKMVGELCCHKGIYLIPESTSRNLIVQQFTGLKDKNGKEIYEGDIVNIFNHNQAEEVMYEPCGTAFGFFKHDSASREDGTFEVLSDYTGCDGYEIIGNIFENPQLLKA